MLYIGIAVLAVGACGTFLSGKIAAKCFPRKDPQKTGLLIKLVGLAIGVAGFIMIMWKG